MSGPVELAVRGGYQQALPARDMANGQEGCGRAFRICGIAFTILGAAVTVTAPAIFELSDMASSAKRGYQMITCIAGLAIASFGLGMAICSCRQPPATPLLQEQV